MPKSYLILIVEDSEPTLEVLKVVMRLLPFPTQIMTAKDGATALEKLRRASYDAMILDLMLPGMSGQEVLKTINSEPAFKGFPVLVNSTVADVRETQQELQAYTNLKLETASSSAEPQEIAKKLKTLLGIH